MKKLFLIMALVVGLAGAAQANLITNGDFGSGLTDWSTSGPVDTYLGMARLGNGTTSTNSALWQGFDIASGIQEISVDFYYQFSGSDTAPFLNDIFSSSLNFWVSPKVT